MVMSTSIINMLDNVMKIVTARLGHTVNMSLSNKDQYVQFYTLDGKKKTILFYLNLDSCNVYKTIYKNKKKIGVLKNTKDSIKSILDKLGI